MTNMNKWELFSKHEKEREDLTDELNRGRREIDAGMREFDGWASRIMQAIMKPLGDDLEKYPLGHGRPVKGNTNQGPNLGGKL